MKSSKKYKIAQQILGGIQDFLLLLTGLFIGKGELTYSIVSLILSISLGTLKLELYYHMQKYIVREETHVRRTRER